MGWILDATSKRMSLVLSIARQDASETIEFSAGGNFLFKHFQPCMYLCSCLISRVARKNVVPKYTLFLHANVTTSAN